MTQFQKNGSLHDCIGFAFLYALHISINKWMWQKYKTMRTLGDKGSRSSLNLLSAFFIFSSSVSATSVKSDTKQLCQGLLCQFCYAILLACKRGWTNICTAVAMTVSLLLLFKLIWMWCQTLTTVFKCTFSLYIALFIPKSAFSFTLSSFKRFCFKTSQSPCPHFSC